MATIWEERSTTKIKGNQQALMAPSPMETIGQEEEEEEEAEVVVEEEEDDELLFSVQQFVVCLYIQHEKKMSSKPSEMGIRTHFY